MAKTPDLVIDIGHQNIKILQIHVGKKGNVRVLKLGVEPILASEKGEEEDSSQYQRLQETLPILLQRLSIKPKRAIVTLPGRTAFTRRLKVPLVRGRQLKRIIQYEARQHIPFPIEQVNMDYQINELPGDTGELEVNLVAVRCEIADAYAKVLRKCGIRTDIIEVSPLSIYNAYAATPHRNDEDVTAVVSIGATSTDIVIEQAGKMQFMRSAPVAGNTLTTLLAKHLDLSLEEAEELKKKPASEFDSQSAISPERVSGILEKGFDQIITEIRRSFDFYVSQPDALPVSRVFLCGGTTRMEGVTEFLEDRLGVPVVLLDATEIEGMDCPDSDKEVLRYEPVLAGIAVRSAGRSSCNLSFAPPYIKNRLELEKRMPMFTVMGVLIIAMIGGSVFLLDQMLTTTANAVTQVSEIVTPTQNSKRELAEVRKQQDFFEQRFTRINEVAENRGFITRVYLEVQSLVPNDIWLDSIEVTGRRKITIKGKALNDERISSYIRNLIMSPFFDNEAVVLLDASPSSDSTGSGPIQMEFTIGIQRCNNPSEEEIKFVNELRKLTKEDEILVVKFMRSIPEDPTSDADLLVGVYQQNENERIALIRKIYSCLLKSKDQTVKNLDLRLHDHESNLVEHLTVSRELIAAFWDKTKTQDEFLQGFDQITPEPSPTPSHTPTPETEEGEEASTAGMYGMYGMGMYGMGGYGMGMPGGGG